MTRWEIFDPRDGRPVLAVRWEWMARLIAGAARLLGIGWDHEAEGEGWS